jgi:hypothetical protein
MKPKYSVNIKYWKENAFKELDELVGKFGERHNVNLKAKGVMEMSDISNKVISANPHICNPDKELWEKVVWGGLTRYWSKDKKSLIVTYGLSKGWAYIVIKRNLKADESKQ